MRNRLEAGGVFQERRDAFRGLQAAEGPPVGLVP